MTTVDVAPAPASERTLRARAWHYITPDVANAAGISLAELQRFVAGTFHPSDDQLERLARRMGLQ